MSGARLEKFSTDDIEKGDVISSEYVIDASGKHRRVSTTLIKFDASCATRPRQEMMPASNDGTAFHLPQVSPSLSIAPERQGTCRQTPPGVVSNSDPVQSE